MKIKFILLIVVLFAIISCTTVAITGRQQFTIIPESEMNAMSFAQYNQFLDSSEVVNGTKEANMVKTVGVKIQKAVEEYFAAQGMSSALNGYQWEFNLVNDETINAWCMPGGKVVFYTGIMPLCRDEAGVAVVMGHEVAHAIAKHGNERMSQQMVVQLGGMALSKALEEKSETTRQIYMTAFGLGSQVGVMLPFSRLHESEADEMGLIFMAMAGYDPNTAVTFWQRMADLGGQKPPEFLSTHPSDETRIKDLKKLLPKALQYYKP
ncbi:MAG: M48 family metallopeptidase [Calditrichaceae bacterium]|nr:M48 family metallopeptidase [Calditrichaceae bacterium]